MKLHNLDHKPDASGQKTRKNMCGHIPLKAWASLIFMAWFRDGFQVTSPDFKNYKPLSGAMS